MNLFRGFFKSSHLRWFYILVCLMLLGIGISAINVRPKTSIRQEANLRIENKTQALQVEKLEVIDKFAKILLKNNYTKNINSFELYAGGGNSFQVEFIDIDQVIAPGATYQVKEPLTADMVKEGIIIRAVTFDDGTADGDAKIIKQIKDTRMGERMLLVKVLPLLTKTINSSNADLLTNLDALESQISSLLNAENSTLPDNVRIGSQNAKYKVINNIKEIKREYQNNLSINIREKLITVKDHQEKRLAKL